MHRADNLERGQLRTLVDNLKQKVGEGVVVLASAQPEGKVAIIAGVTPGLTKRIQAGKLVGAVAKTGGRIGRRQAGDRRGRRQRPVADRCGAAGGCGDCGGFAGVDRAYLTCLRRQLNV